MTEHAPRPDLDSVIRQALQTPDPSPVFVERLHGQLVSAPRGRRTGRALTLWAWALAAVVVLILAALFVGPNDLVAALQRLLGYIPGIGMVDEAGGLRVLAEPVSRLREGITVTVEQAVLDSERTVVVYQADGIPHTAYPDREDSPFCGNDPRLRLSDGTLLSPGEGSGRGWGSGFESRMVFPAVPAEVDQVNFILPCLMDTAPGAAPEDWELPLRFVAAPPELTVAPVRELTPPAASTAPAEAPAEMGLSLEQVIELEDAYILMGSFRQGDALPQAMVMGISVWPEITNAAGQTWPFDIPDDIYQPTGEAGIFPWAYQVPKGFAAPLTITLAAVDVEFPADLSFSFNAGPAPQPEQEWTLNQEFEIAGYSVRLISAVRHEGPRQNGYEFFFEADPEVSMVSIEDPEHAPAGGYGGGSLGGFSAGFVYSGPVPTGVLTFHVTGLMAQYPGPWTLTWSPPGEDLPATSVAPPQACLTLEAWQQALTDPAPPPEGLAGHLIAYGRIVEDGQQLSPENAGVFVFDLASGQRLVLGPGTWPSLSPDGVRAAYAGPGGLRVVDLATGENRPVPGTAPNDYGPRWSPDGSQLAFRRDLNLYLINPDGTGLRRVTAGPEYELLVDWSADGSQLVYAAPGPQGLRLRSIDLAGGAPSELFVIDAKDISAALSPDGLQIAYMERLPGSMEYGLFLAAADGSQPRLLALFGGLAITHPVWSPDGGWLLVNVTNIGQVSPATVPMLIDPSACQAIPLAGIDGTVQDWSR